MVGLDTSQTERIGRAISGNAAITIDDFTTPEVDVEFSNIVDEAGYRRADIAWRGLTVSRGTFISVVPRGLKRDILGAFYGPNQEEVAGSFLIDNDMTGAYGAKRN